MILGVPCIGRPDLLLRLIGSVDEPCTVLVVDNSPDGTVSEAMGDRARCLWFPSNLGVAASWNLVVKSYPAEPWWLIANADTVLGPGDLARLRSEMDRGGARWVGMSGDWRVFGITRECVDAVGLFDENYHPIYVEDADYERRCDIAGVPRYSVPGIASHEGSATIRDPRRAASNARTYPANVAYHEAKWGVGVRQAGGHSSPFGRGGSVRDWTLDTARVRALSWSEP